MKKKILAIVMMLAMVLSLLPMTAVTAKADTATVIPSAIINVNAPLVGSTGVMADSIVSVPAGQHYSVKSAYWEGSGSGASWISLDSDDVASGGLQAGKNYAISVTLKADDGYVFERGTSTYTVAGTGAQVNGSDNSVFCRTGMDQDDEGGCKILITPQAAPTTVYLCLGTTEGGKYKEKDPGNINLDFTDSARNMAPNYNDEVTLTAQADDGYVFKGWYEGVRATSGDSIGFVTGNNGKLISSDTPYTFNLTKDTNIQAVFEPAAAETVTITIDMDGHGDNIVKTVPKGTWVGSIWEEIFWNSDMTVDYRLFNGTVLEDKVGYNSTGRPINGNYVVETWNQDGPVIDKGSQFIMVANAPKNTFTSLYELITRGSITTMPLSSFDDPSTYYRIDENTTYYTIWFDTVDKIELTATAPACGTEVTTETDVDEDGDKRVVSQSPQPDIKVKDGVTEYTFAQDLTTETGGNYVFYGELDEDGYQFPFKETLEGGNSYPTVSSYATKYGYVFAETVTVTADGLANANAESFLNDWGFIYFAAAIMSPAQASEYPLELMFSGAEVTGDIAVEHSLTHVDAHDATCTEDGTVEHWKCEGCGKMFSDATGTTEIDATTTPALGHSWGEWTVTKEASCTETGSEQRVCSRDASHVETREVAALGHSWDDGVVTTEATCEEAGVKTYTCSRCGETKTEEIPALGHDWGEWIVDKEATEEEDGARHRICSRCNKQEDEVIPKLVVEYSVYSGDGSEWTKGSSDDLVFTFKRSINDDKTFSKYTGILVDGNEVAEENFTAEEGSVIITLKAAYLETLSTGKHTLKALFEDGNKEASASFTIKETASDTTAADSGSETKTGDSAPIGLFAALVLAALLAGGTGIVLYQRSRRRRKYRR